MKPGQKQPTAQKEKGSKFPLFITFEGGEGAGKTTLIHRLKEFFEASGRTVVVTREPGGTRLGEEIRKILLHHGKEVKISRKAELMLFLAARAEHVEEVILPSLNEDKIVLCDRFSDSSVAYQGLARGLGMEDVRALTDYVTNALQPDLTFFLDIDPSIGLKRAKIADKDPLAKGKPDRIESEKKEFHKTVQKAFLKMASLEPGRISFIDASKSMESVFQQALEVIQEWPKKIRE